MNDLPVPGTLGASLESFGADQRRQVRRGSLSSKTVAARLSSVRRLLGAAGPDGRSLCGLLWADLAPVHLARARDALLAAGATPGEAAAALSAFQPFQVARAQGAPTPSSLRVRSPGRARPSRLPPSLAAEEVRRLLAAADPELAVLLVLVAVCGLRACEVRGLVIADLDRANGLITVAARADRAGGRVLRHWPARRVPPPSRCVAWLAARTGPPDSAVFQSGGRPMSADVLARRLQACVAVAGIAAPATWSALRAFALASWAQAGLSLADAMRLAGDDDARVTRARPAWRQRSALAALARVGSGSGGL